MLNLNVQQQLEELQQKAREKNRQSRRRLVAAIACIGAAISVFPGAWQPLAEAPLISWLLAGLAISLLWPRNT